jgi:hypothetical protein
MERSAAFRQSARFTLRNYARNFAFLYKWQELPMSHQDANNRRREYRPGFVIIAILTSLVVGLVLKTTREQRFATSVTEEPTQASPK